MPHHHHCGGEECGKSDHIAHKYDLKIKIAEELSPTGQAQDNRQRKSHLQQPAETALLLLGEAVHHLACEPFVASCLGELLLEEAAQFHIVGVIEVFHCECKIRVFRLKKQKRINKLSLHHAGEFCLGAAEIGFHGAFGETGDFHNLLQRIVLNVEESDESAFGVAEHAH